MLELTVPAGELWDEENCCFILTKETRLNMEHSLVSISKWEAIWQVAFLSQTSPTQEQMISYAKCMTLTQNVDENVYRVMTAKNIEDIYTYINNPMSATRIRRVETKRSGVKANKVTSELIYFWMVQDGIPFECQKWHLNRLLNLIEIYNIKNSGGKKMSKNDIFKQNSSLNAQRRRQLNSLG